MHRLAEQPDQHLLFLTPLIVEFLIFIFQICKPLDGLLSYQVKNSAFRGSHKEAFFIEISVSELICFHYMAICIW